MIERLHHRNTYAGSLIIITLCKRVYYITNEPISRIPGRVKTSMLAPQSKNDPVIVVGAGSAGLRVAKDLTKHAPWRPVHSFNGEPSEPYNRVLLTPLVAGEIDTGDVYQTPCAAEQFHQHLNNQIRSIDRGAGLVVDDFGMHHRYSYLVLATGSQPIVPNIAGVDLPEVFTFRTLADAARLVARVAQGDRFVVIGGGLLG